VDVVIIGAGHCGLALSWVRGQPGISHGVLERGEMANSRRTDRATGLATPS
jgi:putative flavoprotein involved in K+ transport